jgi:hypothetical protein
VPDLERPFFSNCPPKRTGLSEKLDPEAKRLRNVSSGELADAIGALEARVEVLKAEAILRELRRAEGEAYRIVLTPPGTAQRHRDDMAGNAAPRAGCVRTGP